MTSRQRLRRIAAPIIGLAFLTSACGLKPEAVQSLKTGGGGGGGGGGTGAQVAQGPVDTDGDGVVDTVATGQVDTDGDGVVDADAGGPDTTGAGTTGGGGTTTNTTGGAGTAGGGGGGGTAGGGTTAPGGGTTTTGSGPAAQAGPGNRTGVTDREIRIGIHAPLSGASPLPQDSFDKGARLYWEGPKGRKVFGRQVVVEVKDDKYLPNGAVQVCQEMARRDFMVIGGAGTDQIQACGRDRNLQRSATPYLSAGVTENGLQGVQSYFAISMSYKQQARTLVRSAEQQGYLKSGKWALVLSKTPNFEDAKAAIEAELSAKGVEHRYFPVPKAGSDRDAVTLANELRAYGAPVVYFLSQPTFFLKVVPQTQNQLYKPIWTGVGISMGLNTVTKVACDSTNSNYDGRFLSPFPGLDQAPQEFRDAGGTDDIQLSMWGLSELLYKAMLTTKGNLSRENFIASLQGARLPSGAYPSVGYQPNNHFGGTAAWQLKSNCGTDRNDTVGRGPIT